VAETQDGSPNPTERLIDAIYRGSLEDVRGLLESGVDPTAPVDDGFPPIIAALSTLRSGPGLSPRKDVNELLHLLLRFGADPEQRGVNDYAALHMAVAEGDLSCVTQLLDAGADLDARTRIDSYETPLELARAAGLTRMIALLEQWRRPLNQRLRSGLLLLVDVPGDGELLRRQHDYLIRSRLWANGELLRRSASDGAPLDGRLIQCDGTAVVARIRLNRGHLVQGLFYGIDGMRIGGLRRLELAPHLAYGAAGVPGLVAPNATLTAEVIVLSD
jgi:hypothetical protein